MISEYSIDGELVSPDGLVVVDKLLKGGLWNLDLKHSGYDSTLYLRTDRNQDIDFEMESGQGPGYLFSGGGEATNEYINTLLSDFSFRLTNEQIVHRVELSLDLSGELCGYWHFGWPFDTNLYS